MSSISNLSDPENRPANLRLSVYRRRINISGGTRRSGIQICCDRISAYNPTIQAIPNPSIWAANLRSPDTVDRWMFSVGQDRHFKLNKVINTQYSRLRFPIRED